MEIKKWFTASNLIGFGLMCFYVFIVVNVVILLAGFIFLHSWNNEYAKVLDKKVIGEDTYVKCVFGDGSVKDIEYYGKEQFGRVNVGDEVKADYTIGLGWSVFGYR